jgi:hypothetical protein
MKHKILQVLFLLGIFICTLDNVHAQCTPNNDPLTGIEPDTLSTVYVDIPYEQIIYFKLPLDTVVEFYGIPLSLLVDSLIITGYTGLPPGFSLACNVPSCTLLGGQNGCAAISGTATAADVGIHPLKVYVTTFVSDTFGTTVGGFPDSIDFYFLDIQIQSAVQETGIENWSVGAVYPNPAGDMAGIPIHSTVPGELVVSVLDFSGRQVAQHTMDAKMGDATYRLDVSQLPIGFYMLKIMQGGYSGYRSMEVVR